jgi:hypothetical protein
MKKNRSVCNLLKAKKVVQVDSKMDRRAPARLVRISGRFADRFSGRFCDIFRAGASHVLSVEEPQKAPEGGLQW